MPVMFIGPRVFTGRGWQMWEDARDKRFNDFMFWCSTSWQLSRAYLSPWAPGL